MWSNWSRGQTCAPAEHVRPSSRAELSEAVANGRAVRVAGAGHSFSGGVPTDGTLLSLERLDRVLDVDRASGLVRAEAGVSLNRLVRELHGHGLALPNLGDIDVQSLAGALITGTHGTGARLGNLASGVEAMELVLADGSSLEVDGGDELRAARVSLGALGVVAAVTLRCVPSFRLHAVDRPVPLDDVLDALDEHVDGNDHFELFTFPHSPLALTRTNNRTDAPPTLRRPRLEWLQDVVMDNHAFWALNRAARARPRAIPRINRAAGRAASKRERVSQSFDVFASPRLVRFEEMEYALPRARAAEAVRAARAILERHPVSFPIELRFSAGDDALLSPAHGRDTAYVAVHVFEGMSFEAPFREVEAVMREWDGRPHWGKRSFLSAEELAPRYPRWGDFAAIRERLDPDRRFVNAWVDRVLLLTSVQRWTLIVVCTSTAVLLVNVAAPNVALAAIADDLDASFTDLQWVLSGYSLVLAVFQLTAGSLADLFGRRKLFAIGLVVFTTASALCALAPSAELLIAARALQGLGAAVMFPASLALLAQEFEGPARGRAIGVWGAVIGLAFAAGPLVGGLLVDAFGWHAIFLLGVVMGLPTLFLLLTRVGESRDPNPRPVDWPGVTTLSLGLFLIVFAVLRGNALGWTSAPVLGLVAAGVLSLIAFVQIELRVQNPMIELRLFRNRTFLGATVIVATLAGGSFGVFVYLSLFLLEIAGGSPVEVGLWLAPLALVAFATSLGAGRLAGRVPLTGALAVGMALTAGGLLLMLGMDADSSWLHLLAGLVVVGAGTGLANPLVTFAHLGVLPPAQGGLASGINNTARQLGLAVGIAALGAVLQNTIAKQRQDGISYDAAFASGINELLLIAVALALIGMAAAITLVRQSDMWQQPA